jgi:hypothetical protein
MSSGNRFASRLGIVLFNIPPTKMALTFLDVDLTTGSSADARFLLNQVAGNGLSPATGGT